MRISRRSAAATRSSEGSRVAPVDLEETPSGFLESPAIDACRRSPTEKAGRSVRKGTRLGPYEILAPLGSGGMGEVYRARDERLGREVAIKVLSGTEADSDRLRRFEGGTVRLAPTTPISSPSTTSGPSRHRLHRNGEGGRTDSASSSGDLSLKKLCRCDPGADGLAKAHEAGIVHRDLKPERDGDEGGARQDPRPDSRS